MMLSFLIIAMLLPAIISAGLLQTIGAGLSCIGIDCVGKGSEEHTVDANPPPVANPGGHHMEEHNPHKNLGSRGKGNQVPAPNANIAPGANSAPSANFEGHHKKEHNPYMQIVDEVGDVWTKLFRLRLINDSEDFAKSCKRGRVAEKMEELADEITEYYNHSGHGRYDMDTKARIASNAIDFLKSTYYDSKIAADLEEMARNSKALQDKVAVLPEPKGKGSQMPALDASPESRPKKEHNPYMQIAEEIGELWTKLFKLRLIHDNYFSRSFRGERISDKVQDLADAITRYYNNFSADHMNEKAQNAHGAIHSLELEYKSKYESKDLKVIGDMSHAIKRKVVALPSPKVAKNGKQ